MCKQKHFKCIFSSASLFAYAIKQSYHFIWKQIFSSIRFWFMIVILTPVQMVKFVCKISLRTSDTQITSVFDSWILLPSCSWRCKHCLFNRIVWFLYLRFYKKFQYIILNPKSENLHILLDMPYLLKKITLGRLVILTVNFKKKEFSPFELGAVLYVCTIVFLYTKCIKTFTRCIKNKTRAEIILKINFCAMLYR